MVSEKRKYHKKFKKHQNPRDYDTYAMLRRRVKLTLRDCFRNFIAGIEVSLSEGNTRIFWSFIKSKKAVKSIPHEMFYGDRSTSDPAEVCELFAAFFASVFEKDNDCEAPTRSNHTSIHTLYRVILSEDEILKKLKTLDPNKGAGPDEYPPHFIKSCALELVRPLHIIYNKSLEAGVFPDLWKVAHIVPIYKTGNANKCENYRPISILSCFGKVFEALVYDHVYAHVLPLLSVKQHGFIRSKSAVTNLLEYVNYIHKSLGAGKPVHSIYTDFKKAFDKVNHSLLISKLDNTFGIHGSLLRWISSYLLNRSQLVAIRGFLSSPSRIASGVPQGSHLGPLLFNIFINDLTDALTCNALLYADDLKIFSSIASIDDCQNIQSDLRSLDVWCKNNFMHLNVSKCLVMKFTTTSDEVNNFRYSLEGQNLQGVETVRDLGIILDKELNYRTHYTELVNSCKKSAWFLISHMQRIPQPQLIFYFI